MITEQEWLNYVEAVKKFNTYQDSLYNLNIDVSDSKGYEAFFVVNDLYVNSIVTQNNEPRKTCSLKEEAKQWIDWWFYETSDYNVIIKDGENERHLDLSDPIDFYDFMKDSNLWAE